MVYPLVGDLFCKRVKDLIIKFSHGERRPRQGARTRGEKESERYEIRSHARMLLDNRRRFNRRALRCWDIS